MTGDGPRGVIERVRCAINAHDLEAFLDCFDEGYESEQPLHPERSFRGRKRVRRNWSANLARVPDLRWELLDGVSAPPPGASGGGTEHGLTAGGSTGRRHLRHRGRPDRAGRLYMGDLPEHTEEEAEET